MLVDDGSGKGVQLNTKDKTGYYQIKHKVNLGQGAALQTGIEFALSKQPDYIITFDADGQHSPNDIEKLLAPLRKNEVDITLGSRFLKEGFHNATSGRTLLIKAGRWVNYLFTGIYLSDSHNGLRGMTKNAASLLNIRENRMAHASEILFFIKRNRLRYKEVPVTISYTDYSRKKGQSGFNSIRIFFDLVLHKLFE